MTPPRRCPVPQPAARAVADLGVRRRAAGRPAARDRHRAARLRRLRPGARPSRRRRACCGCRPFDWPTRPSWLFRLTQGLHVGLGMVLVPVVLAKLWSVIPKLFAWPPARSLAQALERASLLLLVGGILFEIATGLLNIQYDYLFGFSFYTAHYFGAWVFLAAFVAHVVLKLPRLVRGLRSRSLRAELAHPARATPARAAGRRRGLVAARPGAADDEPPRRAGAGRRRVAAARARSPSGRPSTVRCASWPLLLPRGRHRRATGRTASRSTAPRPPPDRPRRHGGRLAARARRRPPRGRLDPRRAAGAAAAHRDAADRLRRGLVDRADLDRGAAARPRRAGRGRRSRRSAPSRSLEQGPFAQATLTAGPGPRPGLAARAAGQRAPTSSRTTASRRGSSCRRCPGCTAPSGCARSTSGSA